MMRLTLYSFKSDVPREKVCQPNVDYQVREFEVEPEESFAFFDKLVYLRDSFYLENRSDCILDFWKEEGEFIWVEITSAEFWAYSAVSRDAAKAIIKTLYWGEKFSEHIPATVREWDAYAFLGTKDDEH